MQRECSLEEISDGKLYGLNDMAKLGSNNCKDCFYCCTDRGNTIILDPLDIHFLKKELKMNFEELLKDYISLNIVDNIILPNIKMNKNNECPFLNEEKRCGIYQGRPGICRIFPLGRYYENQTFKYILQNKECNKAKAKIKISKWINNKNIVENQEFINTWHYFIKAVGDKIKKGQVNPKEYNMNILNNFFVIDFIDENDVYKQCKEMEINE